MKTFFPTAAFAAALFLSCGVYAGIESEVFIRGLQDEKFWTRVHAAEYLTQSDPGNIHLQKWLADAEKRYTALPVKRVGAVFDTGLGNELKLLGPGKPFRLHVSYLHEREFNTTIPQ